MPKMEEFGPVHKEDHLKGVEYGSSVQCKPEACTILYGDAGWFTGDVDGKAQSEPRIKFQARKDEQ